MRLLNRPLGRLSRHRRGPFAGLLVVLFGLLLTGGLYAAFGFTVMGRLVLLTQRLEFLFFDWLRFPMPT